MGNINIRPNYGNQKSILSAFDKPKPYGKKSSFYDRPNFSKSSDNIYFNTYSPTQKAFEGTYRLLIRWKGSVYRLIWHDLLIFLICYFILGLLYRVVLVEYPYHKQHFELMCIYAKRFSGAIPLALLTGFYVTSVISRWWDQFMTLPYPDNLALRLVAFVPGHVS